MKRRVGRVFSGVPGIVLFVCMYLPAKNECGRPIHPYDVWPLCGPYVFGLAVALVLLPLGLRKLAITLRVILYPMAVGLACFGLSLLKVPAASLYFVAVAAGALAIIGCKRCDERAVVRAVIGGAVLCLGWFAFWLHDKPLYGLYVSVAASLVMLIGGLAWRDLLEYEIVIEDRELPRARISRSARS